MSGLYKVAEHLSSFAKKHSASDADAFGRTAFNRYYYAAYLTVRELLERVDASWGREGHANVPGLLEGALLKKVKGMARKQEKVGVLAKAREQVLVKQATAASSEIASILKSAYSVRVAADYEPSHVVLFDHDHCGFRLIGHTDAEARNWMGRVERQKGILLSIVDELGLD